MVAFYPQILTAPVKTVKNVVLFLRERCLFTTQQVTDILRESPTIVVESTAQLEYKFQVSLEQWFKIGSNVFRMDLNGLNMNMFLVCLRY